MELSSTQLLTAWCHLTRECILGFTLDIFQAQYVAFVRIFSLKVIEEGEWPGEVRSVPLVLIDINIVWNEFFLCRESLISRVLSGDVFNVGKFKFLLDATFIIISSWAHMGES